jgi:anti-sigma B factor antagonist
MSPFPPGTGAGTIIELPLGHPSAIPLSGFRAVAGLRGAALLDIRTTELETHVTCQPVGELDAFTVPQFREALVGLAAPRRLVIDLSEVPFMDSAGLGALIGGIRRVREADGEVAVVCNRPTLTRLLHTTGFDRIVPVAETADLALAALASASEADADPFDG